MLVNQRNLMLSLVDSKTSLLIGYIIMSCKTGQCNITSLGVNPSNQRQGHGIMLIMKALQNAKKRHKCNEARLYVRAGEEGVPARTLYAKLNFAIDGEPIKEYYSDGGDAFVMCRNF